jgi:hypothetical protein
MPINLELPNPQKARRFLNLNSEVWILVLVLVVVLVLEPVFA